MNATIQDVAKYAGVSVGSVSAFINGKKLRQENELKIKNAIDILKYKPNVSARGLKSKRTLSVGILIDSFSDQFSATIAEVAEGIFIANGYTVLLCSFHSDRGKEEQKLRYLFDKHVDGALLYLCGEYRCMLDEYKKANVPFVLINEDIPGIETDKVFVNNFKAGFEATERLVAGGHTRVAVIAGTADDYTSIGRIDGYKKALEIHQVPYYPELVFYGQHSFKDAYKIACDILSSPHPPTAIFTTNYHMTVGAVMAMNEMNIKFPDDVSLVGFDRFEMVDVIKPSLTVVEQPMEQMGIRAAELLIKRMAGDYANYPQTIELDTTLYVGASDHPVRDLASKKSS